jgi:ribosomal 50S subunit-associated protein YjgA (DUF615 family)
MDPEKRRAREARTLAKLQALAAAADPLPAEVLAQLQAPRVLRSAMERAERRRVNWRHQANKRHAAKLRRTPPWVDLEAIRALHAEARRLTLETGVEHHVDHVIPLQGRLVSGLHVHTNMQILTGSENSRKWNRFEP